MRIGASAVDTKISRMTLAARRMKPPNRCSSRFFRINNKLSSFGINNKIAVVLTKAIAHSGCHCGQTGKRLGCDEKYSGGTSSWVASSSVLSIKKLNHSGAEA